MPNKRGDVASFGELGASSREWGDLVSKRDTQYLAEYVGGLSS